MGARNLFDFSATDVIRALVDAYIKSEGVVDFPVTIVHDQDASTSEPVESE